MTLDELLALIPDNTTGDISPADLRTIVTELFNAAHTRADQTTYDWTTDVTPAVGKLSLDGGWATGPTIMHIAEESATGLLLSFAAVDVGQNMIFSMVSGTAKLKCTPTGPSVDQGVYRDVPVDVTEATSPVPANNDPMTVFVVFLP